MTNNDRQVHPEVSDANNTAPSLRIQLTFSYVWVTVISVMILEILAMLFNGVSLRQSAGQLLRVGIVLLLVTAPIGGLFGWISSHSLVLRVRALAQVVSRFAAGEYHQRVPVGRNDEIGQLEKQFNAMAGQLVESISQRQSLIAENTRIQERARLSRELHDSISQDLFSLRALVDGLIRSAQSGTSPKEMLPQLEILERTSQSVGGEMRALLLEMRPPQLEHQELAGALAELAEIYRARTGLAVETILAPLGLDPTNEQALLRIAQEAMSNVARHAGATIVRLELARLSGNINLTISDNGRGFNPQEKSNSSGIGLQSIRERAQEIGGRLILDTAPGQGTRLQVVIPEEQKQ